MARERTMGIDGFQVPSRYSIVLHPTDFAVFNAAHVALGRRIAQQLRAVAHERRWRAAGPFAVEFLTGGVRRGRVAVAVNNCPADVAMPDGNGAPTTRFAATQAWTLTLHDGSEVPIGDRTVRIGRATDCEVEISDPRVSRYHAALSIIGSHAHLQDLGSTNGCEVNGEMAEESEVRSGDVLSFGGYRCVLRGLPHKP